MPLSLYCSMAANQKFIDKWFFPKNNAMNRTRRCNFSTIKKLIHLLRLHVLWVHPSWPSDGEKAVSSPGFAFCLHFSCWQQTIKSSFFGVCTSLWAHRNCSAKCKSFLCIIRCIFTRPRIAFLSSDKLQWVRSYCKDLKLSEVMNFNFCMSCSWGNQITLTNRTYHEDHNSGFW